MMTVSPTLNWRSASAKWEHETVLVRSDEENRVLFAQRSLPILERHRQQSVDRVKTLRKQYDKPVFGKVRVWDLIERLGSCIDPTDQRLFCASQQVHVLQMLEAMEENGAATPDMVLVALIHDLGKVLLLTRADPADVVCMNGPVGHGEEGAGLESTMIQWNHDEFAYDRLKAYIPDDLAWLIRYHSVEVSSVAHLMHERDLERAERLLIPFAHYDHAYKSPFYRPSASITKYRDVIEEAFPRRIRF